jgi:hypothetical protein
MSCFAIYTKHNNRQAMVYQYNVTDPADCERAKNLALNFARREHAAGFPCSVEQFHMLDTVGILVHDTEG